MYKVTINGEELTLGEYFLAKDLSLRELCKIINDNQYYTDLYIFHPCFEDDIEKDFLKSKESSFEYSMIDDGVENVVVGIRGWSKALPLWLIESNEWVVRIEEKHTLGR